ncbi:alpha-2-macroglobulin family protein [Galbibacter pacificus]|uniref:MG2 domain-containing protein n=1 Tax=Galbibacter pacificus TaxID=2996052 RepID=A0ABT6FTT0_9FLAO|nr:MG2 domain-containing protein [Galbibacter pacificus]MDG3583196.1 MG2 domain-containing protein [Galbibacter pacificus]MDG3586677.1 MG2 domain-containing protein [Galbibacter pacificus]
MSTKKVLFFLLAILLIGCKNKKEDIQAQKENLFKYRAYISDVSPGIISAKSDVRVVLKNPVSSLKDNMVLDDDILKVSPQTKGKVMALNNQTIAFIPEKGFKQDTEYTFSLDLESLIDDISSDLETFTFKVKTFKQQFNITTDNLQSYNKDWQYLNGTLRSSDVMNLKTAKNLVTAYQNGKELTIKFDETVKEGTQIPFKVDSIQRYEEDSEIDIHWDGNNVKIHDKGDAVIKIPGKNNFTIIDINTYEGENQYLEINFSDPLKKSQNVKGLVTLENADDLKFIIDGNILKVYPQQQIKGSVNLSVFQGIESTDGYKLKNIFSEKVAFEQLKPQVRLLSSGNILPSSNNLKINFEAVNLKAVDVTVIKIYKNNILQFLQNNDLNGTGNLRSVARPIARKALQLQSNLTKNTGNWRAYAIDLRELINPDPGAIYRVEFSFGRKYSAYSCTDPEDKESFELNDFEDFDEEMASTNQWNPTDDSYYYDDYYYDYNWDEREDPCSNSYYYDKTIKTNVIASDIGLTVKKGKNESYFVSANDIVTTNPLPGTKVTFYNYQQQPIGYVITETSGTSIFDSETPAYFAIAERNKQKTYIKLNDGNALSVSKFDVSGAELQKGLKGFIYGERGVWRPGDTLFLNFILNDKNSPIPASHPVKFELTDPYGKIVHKEIKNSSIGGFYNFKVVTSPNAPTGNWLAKIQVGGASFSKSLKIETIKPNRLKIKVDFEDEILSPQKPINGNMAVIWLHGAIAKNLKSDIQTRFTATKTTFDGYPNYVFDDPTRKFNTEDQTVFDGKINAEGKASFNLVPQLKGKAPGMLKTTFITKVYEDGGDFSTDVFSKTYSPYSTYVGLRVPDGDARRNMLLTDKKHTFEVATVDKDGKPKAVKNIKVSIYKIDWRWWWDTSEDNLSSFNGSNYQDEVFTSTFNTDANGKANFKFELKYPEWGRYLVRIEDPESGHATGETVYFDWPGWAGKSKNQDPEAATMLVFSSDKDTYNVGEKATVIFPSSEGGRALVTVENGSEVLKSMWVIPEKDETKFELPIEELYTPNIYIHISLIQPHASTVNDAPIRMYGVIPITVNNPETILKPTITMPNSLKPEERFKIKVGESNNKPMTYTIAVVDEGLLDLTRFKTPNPWDTFFAREALGVKTWDVYDDIIGAFGGRIDQIFSIGGDGMAAGAKNKKANRFKPMVVYLGPYQLKEGETNTHTISVPKYIGSVRTMVIAGNISENAYGITEKTTPVKKPLMVLASAPRKITPKETVTLPVTVFAMEKNIKNVTVSIKKNKAYKIIGESSKTISFSQPDEQMVYFDVQVNQITGIGEVEVQATSNGEKASYKLELDVVNPNPFTTSVKDITLEAGAKQEFALETFGIDGSNSAQIEFSTLPPMNFTGRLQYLIQYPHGCVEQTTSSVFPQLYLNDIFDLTFDKKKKVQQNIEKAINRLSNFQLPNGGFSYWMGQNQANEWGTSYAGHFLLEAEQKGYVLPIGFKSKWTQYQQQLAKQWRNSDYSSSLNQAYRLYTLALAGNPDVSSMNRLRETPSISNEAKHRLAAAYALIGQQQAATSIFKEANISFEPVKYDYYTYGSTERNEAMALETLVLLKNKNEAQQIAKTVAKNLASQKWMSTQTTAYCLLSMAKFAEYIGGKGITASFTVNGSNNKVETEKVLANRALEIHKGSNPVNIENKKDGTLFVRVISTGKLPVGEEKTEQRNLKAIVAYKGRDGKNIAIDKLTQGTNFIAEVTITNAKGDAIKDVALTEIFPSGWEIVNTRFTDFGSFADNDANYTDIRDDRSNFYFDLKGNESKTFRILLNASYLGKYYLPGIQCEAMYDNDFMVRTQGKWVEVVQ